MNKSEPLFRPPVASTDFHTDAELCGDIIRYEFTRDGLTYMAGIRFLHVVATRTRSERLCSAWHIEGAYDALVRVEGSEWLAELTGHVSSRAPPPWPMHHFMIYLDSAGCFEVVATSWAIVQDKAVPRP